MKQKIVLSSLVLLIFFSTISQVSAQAAELPNPGLTPASPFYFLDVWGEKLSLLIPQAAESKARKRIKIAQEKLAEAQAVSEEGDDLAVQTAVTQYGQTISLAAQDLAQAAQSNSDQKKTAALAELLAKTDNISQSVLTNVEQKVSAPAQPVIEQARKRSEKGMQQGLDLVPQQERTQVRQRVEEHRQIRQKSPVLQNQEQIPSVTPVREQQPQTINHGSEEVEKRIDRMEQVQEIQAPARGRNNSNNQR